MCVLGEELAAKQHITNRAAGLPRQAVSVIGYTGLQKQGMDLGNAEEQISRLGKWQISGRFGLVMCCYRKLQVVFFDIFLFPFALMLRFCYFFCKRLSFCIPVKLCALI